MRKWITFSSLKFIIIMCWVLSVSTDEILILEVINHLIKIKMHVVSFDGVIKERLLHKEI